MAEKSKVTTPVKTATPEPVKAVAPVKAPEPVKAVATPAPAAAKPAVPAPAAAKPAAPAKAKAPAKKKTPAKKVAVKKAATSAKAAPAKSAAVKKTAVKKTAVKKATKAAKPAAAKFDFDKFIADSQKKAASYDASGRDFLAVQVYLKDLDKVFYVEVKDGKLSVAPYEYYDRQANLIIKSADFVKLMSGELDGTKAFLTRKLKIEGSIEKAKELSSILGSK